MGGGTTGLYDLNGLGGLAGLELVGLGWALVVGGLSGEGLRDPALNPDPRSIDICFVPPPGVGKGLPTAFVGDGVLGPTTGGLPKDELEIDPGGVFSTEGLVGEEGAGARTWIWAWFAFVVGIGKLCWRAMGIGGIDSGRDLGMGRGRPEPEGVAGDGGIAPGCGLGGEWEARAGGIGT